jgi:spore coat polysaccharide biosynthesis protein SpsF
MSASKIGLVIQARTGSTRLPKKVVKSFYQDRSILEIIIARLKESKFKLPIIVATSDREEDEEIARIALRSNVEVFRGDEKNVLNRMICAADSMQLNHLVRVCADNIFLSTIYLDKLLDEFNRGNKVDYLSYKDDFDTPAIKTHFGFFCEIASVDALKRATKETSDPFFLEHVTLFLYTRKELFNLKFLPIPDGIGSRNDLRFTIDTEDDFNLIQEIYSQVCIGNNFIMADLIKLVTANQPYLERMKRNIYFNSK